MFKNDFVGESNSEYHSRGCCEKVGKYLFCVDYRILNRIIKALSFSLPRLECVFDTIAEAEFQLFFSTSDLGIGNYKWVLK